MVIGIGGCSRSGKTSLAFLIKDLLAALNETVIVLSQDDFVQPIEKIPLVRHRIDWERPESIDFEKYKAKIIDSKLTYQHVITEGLFNFNNQEIVDLLDYKLFTQISKETFLKRKAEDKRWGYEPKWFVEHIWKSYLKYGRSYIENPLADVLIVSGERDFPLKIVQQFLGLPPQSVDIRE